jgi:hypothetical protein
MCRCPYKGYSSLTRDKLTGFYFLHLLYVIYYSVTTHLRRGYVSVVRLAMAAHLGHGDLGMSYGFFLKM